MEHKYLVKQGVNWLGGICDMVIPEPYNNNNHEIPDVIGFKSGGRMSYLIEAKAGRTDFENEWKKEKRKEYGGMGNYRYYLAPTGIISESELEG